MGYQFFDNADLNYRMQFTIGSASSGVVDVGEVLTVAEQVTGNDDQAWYEGFRALAERIESAATASAGAGHTVSARQGYLRASAYYAAAMDGLVSSPDSPHLRPTFGLHRKCWNAFARLCEPALEQVRIPFADGDLPGYFVRADHSGSKRPTLIITNGSDGAITSVWDMALAAKDRGYHVLLYDGPGQQSMLFEHNTRFRADWEVVVTAVVDHLIARPDVDADRLAIYGISQAGYWVPRALAFEHRVAAGILDPGVVDVSASWTAELPPPLMAALTGGDKAVFDEAVNQAIAESPGLAKTWWFRSRPYGSGDPYDVYSQVIQYHLRDVASRIVTPLFIADPEGEQFWPEQSEQLASLVSGPVELCRFTAAEGADMHCEPMARKLFQQRAFDWLDQTLGLTN